MNKPGMRVVSGVLFYPDASFYSDGSRVLMGLRKPGGKRPGLWELPGGKLEPGEDPRQALSREWGEELGLSIVATDYIATSFLDLEVSFHIDLYVVRQLDDRQPQALYHVQLEWVSPLEAVQHLPCSPAFYLHWPHLRRFMAG